MSFHSRVMGEAVRSDYKRALGYLIEPSEAVQIQSALDADRLLDQGLPGAALERLRAYFALTSGD